MNSRDVFCISRVARFIIKFSAGKFLIVNIKDSDIMNSNYFIDIKKYEWYYYFELEINMILTK